MSKLKATTIVFAAAAIAITATMDAAGFATFSALPLLPLGLLFWLITRHSWEAWGIKLGKLSDYGLALAYPVFVMGVISIVLVLMGQTFNDVDWNKALLNAVAIGGSSILATYLTEEGFFRGSLFAGFKGAGFDSRRVVVFSSIIFAVWHVSWATVAEEGKLPLTEFPIYILNSALLGLVWGLLRHLSSSVLVASVSHGVWNGMAYTFFGLGGQTGFLAISDPYLYGPERGFLGIALNTLFIVFLWRKAKL